MPRVPGKAVDQLSGVVTEKQWQNTVVELAEWLGWWVFHDHDSRRNQAGFPDLCLVRPPRVAFVELKRESGRLTPTQTEVLGLLEACPGVETMVARPSDWSALVEWLS
jgi:hypothetical protein